MILFYNPDITELTENLIFDKEESRHIVKVLRKSSGDILHVTNGLGQLFKTEIVVASDNKCIVRSISMEASPKPKYKLHMAVAPTKMIDRFEWFLEKATEIGVTEITPLICDHSERKIVKTERFDKIIVSAMKQSLQFNLPILNPIASFNEFISRPHEGYVKCIAHCEVGNKQSFKNVLTPATDVLILIGPEGDFSIKEIKSALDMNYHPVTLGETRLRTETAAIAACHSVAFINQ